MSERGLLHAMRDWRHWDDRLMDGLLWLSTTRRIVLVAISLVLGLGWAYSLIEGAGPVEGPYWAVVTGTSTGYGDFSPASTPGRFVAMLLMVLMLMVVVPLWTAHLIGVRDERTGDDWSHEEQLQVMADARAAAAGVAALTAHLGRLEAALKTAGVTVPARPTTSDDAAPGAALDDAAPHDGETRRPTERPSC